MPALDPLVIAVLAAGLLFAGAVKGALGVGLPLIAMPMLLVVLPAPVAVVVMGPPILLSNLLLMLAGGHVLANLRQFWPIIVSVSAGLFLGSRLLVSVDEDRLITALGVVVLVFAAVSLTRFKPVIAPRWRGWAQPFFGLAGGVLGGFSTVFGPPISMYLVAIGLPKDRFVSAVGTTYFAGSLALNASLATLPFYGRDEALLAAATCLPVFVGMTLGRRLRAALAQETFLRAVWVMLILSGGVLIARGFGV